MLTGRERRALQKMVYEKYPVSKAEMKCRDEKAIMDRLREVYKKKLIEGWGREKQEY